MKKVPNLRFKEFKGEWEQHVLGDIFEFYTTNSFSRDFLDNDNGSVKNIHYGDIHMKFPTLLNIKNTQIPYVKESVDLSKISLDSYCKNGDVVIADASEDYNDIGKAIELQSVGEERVIAGLHTILARDNKGIMVNGFRGYLMTSPNVRKQIKVYAAGAKVLGISKANISKVKLLIPSGMEQEKIAAFFYLIDKKIGLQTEKVEELKNYKKGLMQKIFSQELRFKDENGNKYPEWERKRLQDIVEKKIKGKNPIYSGAGNILLNNDFMENNTEPLFVGNEIDVNINDILILWDGSQAGKVYTGFEGVLGSTFVAITLNKDNCNIFIREQLEYNLNKIQRVWREGSGVPHVAKDFIENYKIFVPSYEEQSKISKMLLNSNEKIQLEERKLQYIKELKKGLLQQMFI